MSTETEPDLLEGLKTAAQLDGMVFDPLVQHVQGLIVEGFSILAGAPKVGKSWLAVHLALACAQGGIALNGIRTKPRNVLLLALEDGDRRLQDRMRRLNFDEPLPEKLEYLTEVDPLLIVYTINEWLIRHAADENPPLVILDTLGRAKPQKQSGGEEQYLHDYQFGVLLKSTVDAVPGAALLAVHHKRKADAADWVDTLSGTQGIGGSADSILVLTRERKSNQGLVSVTGRDIVEGEYALTVENGLWRLDGGSLDEAAERAEERVEKGKLGDRSMEVLRFVNGRSETRASDLLDIGMSVENARVYLKRLLDSGRIARPERGLYTPVINVMSSETNNINNTTPIDRDEDSRDGFATGF